MLFGLLLSLTQLYNTSHALVNEDVTLPRSLFQYRAALISFISLLLQWNDVTYVALTSIEVMQLNKCLDRY